MSCLFVCLIAMPVSWSEAFSGCAVACICSCPRTCTNYLAHLRAACQFTGVADHVFDSEQLKRAVRGIQKRTGWQPRAKKFFSADMVAKVLEVSLTQLSLGITAMWMCTAFVFLLRCVLACLASFASFFGALLHVMLRMCVLVFLQCSV